MFYRILHKIYGIDDMNLPLKSIFDVPPGESVSRTLLYAYLTYISIMPSCADNLQEVCRNKYTQLHFYMNNPFYMSLHDTFFESFSRAQRHYFSIVRFARLWKIRRSPVRIQRDLCGNELILHSANCMVVYQTDSLYYFSVSDLINICKNALLHSVHPFVAAPICPKNPYTNVDFSKAILYAIYWRIRRSDYNMPIILQLYYNTFFNERQFLYAHESVIRDFYIKDMLKMSDEMVLQPYVKRMLQDFYTEAPFCFHTDFPPKKLHEIMSPFLRLYFLYKYSIASSDEKFQAYFIIKHKLRKMYEFNPTLGRLIYKRRINFSLETPKRRPVYVKTFRQNYVPFHNISIESMTFDTDNDESDESDESD